MKLSFISSTLGRLPLYVAGLILAILSGTFLISYIYQPVDMMIPPQYFYTHWIHVFVFVLFCVGLYLLQKPLANCPSLLLFGICSILFFGISLHFIFHIPDIIRLDPAQLFTYAHSFNHGDYSALTTPGGYLHQYPYQVPLLTLFRLFVNLSSSTRFGFVANAFFLIGSNFFQYRIAEKLWAKPAITNTTIILSFFFLPHFFLMLLYYGFLPGLFFALIGLYYFIVYIQEKRLSFALLSALGIATASLLRNNYQIVAIAVILLTIVLIIQQRTLQIILLPIFITIFLAIGKLGFSSYYSVQTGQPFPKGQPAVSFLVMGLTEHYQEGIKLAGWFNGYSTGVWYGQQFNHEVAKTISQHDLRERISYFVAHPIYTAQFFYSKLRSTWTDPLFYSIASGPYDHLDKVPDGFWKDLYAEKDSYRHLNIFAHAYLLFLYSMSLIGVLALLREQSSTSQVLSSYGLLTFVGVVCFHLLWETRSHYGHYGAFLLIPIAIYGFQHTCRFLSHATTSKHSVKQATF